jgi:hypothetical protein
VNDGDRSHWLDPSPPIDVDGEEPGAPRPRPTLLPPDEPSPAADEPERDPEDARTA